MKTIKLTGLSKTIIDDNQYDSLSKYSWYALNCSGYVYAVTNVNGKTIRMHRMIMSVKNHTIKVDHINGDTLDNRIENLRTCSNAENIRNQKKHSNNTTGYPGIGKYKDDRGKYRAFIIYEYKYINLGRFSTLKEAKKARRIAVKKYFGKFGRLK